MRIANKISLSFFITAMILTSIAAPLFYFSAKDSILKLINEDLQGICKSRAGHIQTFLSLHKDLAESLSESIIFREFLSTKEKSKDYSENFTKALLRLQGTEEISKTIFEIFLLDKDGKIVSTTNKANLGLDRSGDPYFLGARQGPHIKGPYYSKMAKRASLDISAPILSQKGDFLGVVVMRINTEGLDQITTDLSGLGKTGEVYLINKYGFMITPSRFLKDTFLKQKVNSLNARAGLMHKGQEHPFEEKRIVICRDYRGKFILGTHEYIPEVNWILLAETDKNEAFLPLYKLIALTLLILIIVPIIAWLIGIYISRKISKPIEVLHKGTEIIGQGNLDYKVGISSRDEIGQLSRAFDKMTENLKSSTTSITSLNKEIQLRKETEEALRESEIRYKTLYASSSDAIMVLTPEEGFLAGNSATIEIFGCKDEREFTKQNPASLSPEYQPDGQSSTVKAQEMMQIALDKGSHFFEWTHKRLDGKEFFATVLLTRMELAGKTYLQATVRDISRLKEAETKVVEAAQEWENTFNSITDLIFIMDQDNTIIKANRVFSQTLKLEPEEVIGKKCYQLLHRLDKPWPGCPYEKTKKDLQPHTEEVEDSNIGMPLLVTISPVFDKDGKLQGSIHIAKDISEQKRVQEALERAYQTTHDIIENAPFGIYIVGIDGSVEYVNSAMLKISGDTYEQFISLNVFALNGYQKIDLPAKIKSTLNGEYFKLESVEYSSYFGKKTTIRNFYGIPLEEAGAKKAIIIVEDITERKRLEHMKDEFVNTVSHELRTPMTIIKEGVSQILEGIHGNISPQQKRFLTFSLEGINRLSRIINDLLDISRIESGRIKLEIESTDIASLAKEVIGSFKMHIKDKGLELKENLPERPLKINIDKDRIIQVFVNLVGNALKFTEKGFIEIAVLDKKDFIECSVADTGAGIAEENQPKLFSKFEQFGRKAGPGEKGTGLGLAISKGIIEMHQGKIWVESKPGQGTKIAFTLPKKQRNPDGKGGSHAR